MELTHEAHALIGGWAIEYKPLLTQVAFDELERRVMLLIAAERERCAKIAESVSPSGFTGVGKLGNSFAIARDGQARRIAYLIRALP